MILALLRRLFPGGTTSVSSAPQPLGAPSSSTAPQPSAPLAPATKFYQQTNRRTPNISPGRNITPTHIILHHTSGAYAGSVSWCLDPVSKVSYHCIISRSGKRTVLAPPSARTWHAGVSSWQGRPNCNNYALGLAWEGDTYTTPLSEDALLSAVEYLLPILEDYDIPLKNILRHEDIAPGRKNDCSPAAQSALLSALRKVL